LNNLDEYSKYNYKSTISTTDIEGELKKLCDGVNLLGESITQMLLDNRKTGLNLQNYSTLLATNMQELSHASNEQAASLEETAAALEEITANVRNNTDKATQMARLASDVQKESNSGDKMAHDTATAMIEINNSTNAINEAITVIDQIAFQTNILSLNAAVEAASAGEAGKGFAVVAGEVRNLASRSAEAAKEIKELVESAQYKANEGKNIANEMIKGYVELNKKIQEQSHLIEDVVTSSKEQMEGIEQINDSVTQLDGMTQRNTQMVGSTNDVSKSTENIAKSIVEFTDNKEFNGKESIKIEKRVAKSTITTQISKPIKTTPTPKKISTAQISTPKKSYEAPKVVSSSDDDEWAEF
jgi:methyl-accepting chemotaxis protein